MAAMVTGVEATVAEGATVAGETTVAVEATVADVDAVAACTDQRTRRSKDGRPLPLDLSER